MLPGIFCIRSSHLRTFTVMETQLLYVETCRILGSKCMFSLFSKNPLTKFMAAGKETLGAIIFSDLMQWINHLFQSCDIDGWHLLTQLFQLKEVSLRWIMVSVYAHFNLVKEQFEFRCVVVLLCSSRIVWSIFAF